MKIQRSFDEERPTLYLVSTPIGNLADMTYRAITVLKDVDTVFAEDTRTSKILLDHYGVSTPLQSFHAYNEDDKAASVLKTLRHGKSVALVSDAGTPLISDPGARLVQVVLEEDFPVVPLPGASAALSALIVSGMQPHPYLFFGFLPQKSGARQKVLKDFKHTSHTLIFYESPHRLKKTLADMRTVFGNRNVTIARELTKKFEEILRLRLDEIENLPDLKGEMVIVVEGASADEAFTQSDLVEHVQTVIDDGESEMEAIKKVARLRKLKKNTVYMAFKQHKSQDDQE